MFIVGITGGIGSGKTYISHIFNKLGYPVYYADIEAKKLLSSHQGLKHSVIQYFGKEAYLENGELNRIYLSKTVFKDEQKLQLFNGLIHPIVIAHSNEWAQQQTSDFVIKEAAIMFESGSHQYANFIISIKTPHHICVKRVLQRNPALQYEDVIKIMRQQLPADFHHYLADVIIENNVHSLLLPQVLHIIKKIQTLL